MVMPHSHFKFRPKVWNTMTKSGVKFMDLFCLEKIGKLQIYYHYHIQ